METLDNESREYIQSLVKATEDAFNEDKLNDFIETDQFADLIYHLHRRIFSNIEDFCLLDNVYQDGR